jgi:hypothetical protein
MTDQTHTFRVRRFVATVDDVAYPLEVIEDAAGRRAAWTAAVPCCPDCGALLIDEARWMVAGVRVVSDTDGGALRVPCSKAGCAWTTDLEAMA